MNTYRNQFPMPRPSLLLLMVLFGLLPLLQSCSKCSTDHSEREESTFDLITDEALDKFKPEFYTRGDGHSKAFDIQARPEVRVSAPAGAFKQTPQVRVTVPSDNELTRLSAQLDATVGSPLFAAYELDCGLDEDEVTPGRFLVEIDLKKMDIPETLWPYLTLYRMDGKKKLQECNVNVQDGVLHYQACQNSPIVISATVFFSVSIGTAVSLFNYLVKRPGKNMTIAAYWEAATTFPDGLWKRNDVASFQVKDPFGTFNVRYRYSETEIGDDAPKYVAKKMELQRLTDSLYWEAEAQFNKENPSLKPGLIPDPDLEKKHNAGVYDKWLKLLGQNDDVQKIAQDPFMDIPRSILDVVKGARLGMRFCQAEDGLNLPPLGYVFDVFWTNSKYTGPESKAIAQPIPAMGAFLSVNYDFLIDTTSVLRPYKTEMADAVLVSMAHEISHMYEYTYLNFTPCRDQRFMEALGALTEHQFAAWLKKHKFINYDPESSEGIERLGYASQSAFASLAWPLHLDLPSPFLGKDQAEISAGYMLGHLIDFLGHHNPTGKYPSFDHMMKKYAYNKTFVQDMIDIFGFKDENQFQTYFEAFCCQYMADIARDMKDYQGIPGNLKASVVDRRFNSKYRSKRITPYSQIIPSTLFHAPYLCVMRFDQFGHNGTKNMQPFTVKTIKIMAEKEPEDKDYVPYSLFVVPNVVLATHMSFSLLEGPDLHYTADPYFLPKPLKGIEDEGTERQITQYASFITRPTAPYAVLDSEYYVDFVAFYRPMLDPIVRGRSKDGTGLLIDTRDKPMDDLLEHGYVTGMQIAVRNNKTKQTKTFNVPLDQCGKTVKLTFGQIGLSDPDDIDISVATRWYYKAQRGQFYHSPSSNTVDYRRENDKEVQTTDNKGDSLDITDPNGQVSEDAGKPDVTMEFDELSINIDGFRKDAYFMVGFKAKSERVRLMVKDDHFKLTIPAFTDNTQAWGKIEYAVTPITFEGKCEAKKFTSNDGKNDFIKIMFSEKPSELHISGFTVSQSGEYSNDNNKPYHFIYKVTPSTEDFPPGEVHNGILWSINITQEKFVRDEDEHFSIPVNVEMIKAYEDGTTESVLVESHILTFYISTYERKLYLK